MFEVPADGKKNSPNRVCNTSRKPGQRSSSWRGWLALDIDPSRMAITDVTVVASQSAMLALTAQEGNVAIRSDLNKSFVLSINLPSTLADWKELLTPTDVVLSVAGLTGAISASNLRTPLNALDKTGDTMTGLSP